MTVRERQAGLKLMEAAASGDGESVDALLDSGISPSLVLRRPGWDKSTALVVAIEAEQFDIALRLVAKGADVHFGGEGENNAVTLAIKKSWRRLSDESQYETLRELIRALLEKGAKPSPECLMSAAGLGDLSMVRLLLANGSDVSAIKFSKDKIGRLLVPDGDTALAHAVNGGQAEIVIELLRSGASPDVVIPLKGSCINIAVANGHRPIVQALIAAEADLNRRATVSIGSFRVGQPRTGEHSGDLVVHTPASARDATPLIIAVRCKDQGMVQLLVEGGSDITATDADGLTALDWAVRANHKEAEDFLRQHGASDTQTGGNPLHKLYNASAFGDLEKIREALASGADVNGIVERRGTSYTPLIRAARTGRTAIIEALLQAGANPNLGGRESIGVNITPLILAARHGHKGAVEMLLRAGAKTETRIGTIFGHRGGQNAMQQAKDKGHKEVVRILRAAKKAETAKAGNQPAN